MNLVQYSCLTKDMGNRNCCNATMYVLNSSIKFLISTMFLNYYKLDGYPASLLCTWPVSLHLLLPPFSLNPSAARFLTPLFASRRPCLGPSIPRSFPSATLPSSTLHCRSISLPIIIASFHRSLPPSLPPPSLPPSCSLVPSLVFPPSLPPSP